MKLLTDTYSSDIKFSLSCYDRIILSGALPEISYAQGMTGYLKQNDIRIFDYPKFAEPYKNRIRANAEKIAKEAGIEMEFIRKSGIRKEDLIQKKLQERPDHTGLVHILTVMETCPTFKPWHDKQTGRTFLKPDQSKCLHYYFYIKDEYFGLCYIRVPSWAPFRLQVYINGHNILASELQRASISYTMLDNAFDSVSDTQKAQELADNIDIKQIHTKLHRNGI